MPAQFTGVEGRDGAFDITGPQLVAIIKEHMEANGVVFPDFGTDEGDSEYFTFTASTGAGPFGIQNGSAKVGYTDNE